MRPKQVLDNAGIVREGLFLTATPVKIFDSSFHFALRDLVYVRFVVAQKHEKSQPGLGIFQAVYRLRDEGKLYPYEEELFRTVSDWFNKHLEKPTRFTAAKPPYYSKQSKAISWFRDTAHEHIAYVRKIATILGNHGVSVRMIKAERVGYVVYEDKHQVVAEPPSDVAA